MTAAAGVVSEGFGDFDGWECQSATPTEQSKRVTAPSKTNNQALSKIYDKRRLWTQTYKAVRNYSKTAPTVPPNIGATYVLGAITVDGTGILLTQIALNTVAGDLAGMTLSGHEHVDGTDGDALRSIAHGMTLEKGFGASSFGTTGGDSAESGGCTISCDHAETPDHTGDTAQGENHNPRVEINVTRVGTGATIAGAAWDITDQPAPEGAEAYGRSSVSAIKKLAFAE